MKDSQLYILTSNIAIIMAIASPWFLSSILLLGLAFMSFVIALGHLWFERRIAFLERMRDNEMKKIEIQVQCRILDALENQNKKVKRNGTHKKI